jgi:hypothetical protein
MREDCVLRHSLWRPCCCFCPRPRRAASTEGGNVHRRLDFLSEITAAPTLATAEATGTAILAIGTTEIRVMETGAAKTPASETGSGTGRPNSVARSARRIEKSRIIREWGPGKGLRDIRGQRGHSTPELAANRDTRERRASRPIQARGSGRRIQATAIQMRVLPVLRRASSTGIQARNSRAIFRNG